MSKHSIVQCNDKECQHCQHGRCTCWKIELLIDQGNGLLYCNTYSPTKWKIPYPSGDDHVW